MSLQILSHIPSRYSYFLSKTSVWASKALLVAFSPLILYKNLDPSIAFALCLIITFQGYFGLLIPGEDILNLIGISRALNISRSSLTTPFRILYLIILPWSSTLVALTLHHIPFYTCLLISTIPLLISFDIALTPARSAAYLGFSPELVYYKQIPYTILSVLLFSVSLYLALSKTLPYSLLYLFFAWLINSIGSLLTALRFYRHLGSFQRTINSISKFSQHASTISLCSYTESNSILLLVRAIPVLSMLTFGFLPFYFIYMVKSESLLGNFLSIYAIFMIPANIQGSILFSRLTSSLIKAQLLATTSPLNLVIKPIIFCISTSCAWALALLIIFHTYHANVYPYPGNYSFICLLLVCLLNGLTGIAVPYLLSTFQVKRLFVTLILQLVATLIFLILALQQNIKFESLSQLSLASLVFYVFFFCSLYCLSKPLLLYNRPSS